MKKFYSLVLMATALLIGTNAWAQAGKIMIGSTEYSSLDAAFKAAQNNDVIYLTGNVEDNQVAWFGEASPTEENYRSVTLDLRGFTFTSTIAKTVTAREQNIPAISVTHGKLEIKNGTITNTNVQMDGQDLIRVYGTYKQIDAKTQTPFSHLVIDADVTIQNNNLYAGSGAEGANAITIDQLSASSPNFSSYPFDYVTRVFKNAKGKAASGLANGVKLEVYGKLIAKKYAIKVNGNVINSGEFIATSNKKPAAADVAADNKAYSPYVFIGSTASLKTNNPTAITSVAAYSSGYARWQIEGECDGSTGVYVKSGEVVLNNATVSSNYTGTYDPVSGDSKSGVTGAGSALTLESNTHYPGAMDVTVEGDTKLTAISGYAIEENVTGESGVKVDAITINGGTFEGGAEGAIKITETTAKNENTEITVAGGNVNGEATLGEQTLVDYLSGKNETHVTLVTDPVTNKTTMVISEGAGPDVPEGEANVAEGHDENSRVKWIGTSETISGDVELAELEINEATAQTLNIAEGASLTVGRVVLGYNAQIVVAAGAKFIVTGTQGIVAPVASNIVLKASESAQATFLFNPSVTSNRHPNAKVEYHSNSFYSDHNVQQFFGLPTYNGTVTNIETTSDAKIYFDLWENPGWDYIGAINVPGDPDVMANLNKFNLPFGLVCITSKNDAAHKPVFTFSGELTGNMDHTFTLYQGWTSLANAYTGPIAGSAIISQLAAWNASYGTEQNVYVYTLNPATGNIQWSARNKYALTGGLNAMAPIMFHNGSKVEGVVLDYSTLVWDPFTKPAAPARRAINNITKAQINIAGENESDYTTIVADTELGNDRSFCAPKYDNAGLQLYVSGNEKFDIYAADEIENSYIGYRTVNAGMYTISFENVQGEDLVLVDLANGARTNIEEGAIYTFHAEANESNDYRFEIVGRANMPTAIENTEAVKSAKGVYTITGQYVGEMNVWNALPAGVYVVNGEKRVK